MCGFKLFALNVRVESFDYGCFSCRFGFLSDQKGYFTNVCYTSGVSRIWLFNSVISRYGFLSCGLGGLGFRGFSAITVL